MLKKTIVIEIFILAKSNFITLIIAFNNMLL